LFVYGGTINIANGKFERNTANGNGGAMYIANDTFIQYGQTFFTNNTATYGGAMCIFGPSSHIKGRTNTFRTNNALYGGGVYMVECKFEVMFDEYNANAADQGGCLYLKNSQLETTTGLYEKCSAKEMGGGMFVESNSEVQFFRSTVSRNRGNSLSAGIYCKDSIIKGDATFFGGNYGTNLFCSQCQFFNDNPQCNCQSCN